MRDLLDQIQKGLDANLYYLSLFAALVIPDICGAMQSENGWASREKYAAWFDTFIAPKYNSFLSGETCYQFRNSLLHQGSTQREKNKYQRLIFVEPSVKNNIFHNNIMNDGLNIDIRIFCSDVIAGAQEWLKEMEQTELYKKRLVGKILWLKFENLVCR